MKQLTNLKKNIRIALYNDWLKKDPFLNYKLSWKKVDRDYLSEEELESLVEKQFTIDPPSGSKRLLLICLLYRTGTF